MELLEFVEKLRVELLATGGVENHDGAILGLAPLQGLLGDFDEIFFGRIGGVAGNVDLLGELGQLVDGRRSIEVERDEKGTTAFFLEAERELGGGGGFTGTVEAAEEDVSGGVEIDGGLVAAEEVGELVLEDFDDLLAGFATDLRTSVP